MSVSAVGLELPHPTERDQSNVPFAAVTTWPSRLLPWLHAVPLAAMTTCMAITLAAMATFMDVPLVAMATRTSSLATMATWPSLLMVLSFADVSFASRFF